VAEGQHDRRDRVAGQQGRQQPARGPTQGQLDRRNALWIGAKKWEFTTPEVAPPAGLYVYEANGERNSWIVEPNGGVTGVQRRADGATAPAAGLSPDGTSVLDGQTVTATKVQGGDDVI
jgi:hypothetical protein